MIIGRLTANDPNMRACVSTVCGLHGHTHTRATTTTTGVRAISGVESVAPRGFKRVQIACERSRRFGRPTHARAATTDASNGWLRTLTASPKRPGACRPDGLAFAAVATTEPTTRVRRGREMATPPNRMPIAFECTRNNDFSRRNYRLV